MSPRTKNPFELCDPTQVAILMNAYHAAWGIICPRHMDADTTHEIELRAALAHCVQKHVAQGLRDTDELTKRCVEELLLRP